MLGIQDHRLTGDDVSFRQTPNAGGSLRARYVLLHYTAGRNLESSVESLCTKKPQGNASAHIVLGRDGRIVQLAPFNVVTWHAGVSQWNGLDGLNHHAIGIEMDNAGLLQRDGERYVSWFGKPYPDDEVRLAEHRHGGGVKPWHHYTEVQIARALELCELLVAHYGLEDVLGHEDVARGRKIDPGPAFPLGAVRARAVGRGADVSPRLVVNASSLNIRSGPGAEFPKVAPALKRGAELVLLEPQDRWSRVAVVGGTDLEGWVCNDFVSRLPATRSGPGAAVLSRAQRALAPTRATPRKAAAKPPARKAATKARSRT
ncbi:N-acetylmuramoyl-L-alanine amidase [Hydrogenophaga sp. BPS33]|uniref:N-acetylmuramoyl-L-alanine amidase n=1 Tax=Hydrogenophaga sp. BPS33 TaxID=2651974 RepID=UPI00131FB2C7|nr:N-acetylmuramoyl-L-alanine amidase [Hydrogenophaga sp. BPS33]QHE86691.1 N-acetylmuramoyl-L-alanine amidase [Hydrogenophaga sp. BPS33]